MTPPGHRLRLLATLSCGAWAVHELRYLLSFGSHAGEALAASGHAYLQVACPLIGLLVVGALSQSVWLLGRPGDDGSQRTLWRMWLRFSLALLCIYGVQETSEAIAVGGLSSLPAITAHGAWVVLPLTAALGLAAALVLRTADDALEAMALRAPRARPTHDVRAPVLRPGTPAWHPRLVPPGWRLRGPPAQVG